MCQDSEWYRRDELLEMRLELAQALAKLNQHNIHDEAVAFGPFCRLRVIDTIVTQQDDSVQNDSVVDDGSIMAY